MKKKNEFYCREHCIHYSACLWNGEYTPTPCRHFKDKADVVEVRHGEWLEQYEGSRLVKCSVCGYEFCDLIECGNYCGNCGAKMDGERRE